MVRLADLNEDGRLDLIYSTGSQISIRLANSTGTTFATTGTDYSVSNVTEFYVDGTTVYYESSGTWKVSTQVNLGAGSHHMTAKWWHSDGSVVSRSVDFTVQ